jgi:hypothetical protein
MMKGGISSDAIGRITSLRIHDAQIVGFVHEKGGSFSFTFQRTDKTVVRLDLLGVSLFGFDKFINGTTVNNLFSWKPDRAFSPEDDDSLRATILEAWSVVLGGEIPSPTLEATVRSVVRDRFEHIVYLDSDYGGQFAAVCRAIDLAEISS